MEAAYDINARLVERVPLVNREGMEIQIKETIARKAGSTLKVDDVIENDLFCLNVLNVHPLSPQLLEEP